MNLALRRDGGIWRSSRIRPNPADRSVSATRCQVIGPESSDSRRAVRAVAKLGVRSTAVSVAAIAEVSRRRRCAAPLARPPPGSALGAPARHERAATEQYPARQSVHPARLSGAAWTAFLARLSSSRPPPQSHPYERRCAVASPALTGSHSQGSAAMRKDRRAGNLVMGGTRSAPPILWPTTRLGCRLTPLVPGTQAGLQPRALSRTSSRSASSPRLAASPPRWG